MRNWTGLVFFAIGSWLLAAALIHRTRAERGEHHRQSKDRCGKPTPINPSLIMLGDLFRPLIIAVLSYVALKATVVYIVIDAGQMFSLFDLAGFLFLLAGYGVWLILRTRHRASPRAARTRALAELRHQEQG